MPELELMDQERTIDQDEINVDDTRLELEEKYMGILGIVPLSIINYIKEHHLYCADPHEHVNQNYESPKKKVHVSPKPNTNKNSDKIEEEKPENGVKDGEIGEKPQNGNLEKKD